MAIGQNPKQPWPYVLKEDLTLDKEHQSEFDLAARTAAEDKAFARWHGKLKNDSEGDEQLADVLFCSIKGWHNYNDPDGEPLEFEVVSGYSKILKKQIDGPSEATLDLLTSRHRNELAVAAMHGAKFTVDDAKK